MKRDFWGDYGASWWNHEGHRNLYRSLQIHTLHVNTHIESYWYIPVASWSQVAGKHHLITSLEKLRAALLHHSSHVDARYNGKTSDHAMHALEDHCVFVIPKQSQSSLAKKVAPKLASMSWSKTKVHWCHWCSNYCKSCATVTLGCTSLKKCKAVQGLTFRTTSAHFFTQLFRCKHKTFRSKWSKSVYGQSVKSLYFTFTVTVASGSCCGRSETLLKSFTFQEWQLHITSLWFQSKSILGRAVEPDHC